MEISKWPPLVPLDETLPLVRGLPTTKKAPTKKLHDAFDQSWAQQVFAKYDRDGGGSIDMSDLVKAFNELRLPATAEVLQRYVSSMAEAEGVDLANYSVSGVPAADFLKIYRQMLAHQAPLVRKRATNQDLDDANRRVTLYDIRTQENDLRETFDRQLTGSRSGGEKTVTKQAVFDALQELGLPDVKGDSFEAFMDFWLAKREREGIDQPLDENNAPAFDFQEFTLVVNDYHTYVGMRENVVDDQPQSFFEHESFEQFQTLRMATPRTPRLTLGSQSQSQATPRVITPRGTSTPRNTARMVPPPGQYGSQVSASLSAVAREPAGSKSLESMRQQMGICA